MRIFRNVFRRKMRAFLTIFGITIGVFALVVMGSMAEKINLLIDGGTRYYSDKVVISDASTPTGGFSTTPDRSEPHPARSRRSPAWPGPAASITCCSTRTRGMSMGVPQGIMGSDLRAQGYRDVRAHACQKGRDLTAADRGKAVVGCDIAKALGRHRGRDHPRCAASPSR